MKNLVQINILIKRMLCRPAMIAVLMLIPMALILVHVLPEKKQSTEIVSGIFIETPDEYTDSFIGYLYNTATGFTFQPYESLPDMKDDVASGKLDAGYSFPVDFSHLLCLFTLEADKLVKCSRIGKCLFYIIIRKYNSYMASITFHHTAFTKLHMVYFFILKHLYILLSILFPSTMLLKQTL